jgi:hypothetical protein
VASFTRAGANSNRVLANIPHERLGDRTHVVDVTTTAIGLALASRDFVG